MGERLIANKYREVKMKRILKRELKSVWNCWEGSGWGLVMCFGWMWNGVIWFVDWFGVWIDVDYGGGLSLGFWYVCGDVVVVIVVCSMCLMVCFGISVFWVLVCGFFIRFVLKYGLRSLICVWVNGWVNL